MSEIEEVESSNVQLKNEIEDAKEQIKEKLRKDKVQQNESEMMKQK